MNDGTVYVKTMVGRVKHWSINPNTGKPGTFGFISPEDTRIDDVFIHFSEIEPWRKGFKEPLESGDIVKFDLHKEASGKLLAKNLELKREEQQVKVSDFHTGYETAPDKPKTYVSE